MKKIKLKLMTEAHYTGPERRKYPRIRGAVVEYALSKHPAQQAVSFTKDVGSEGMCILVGEEIAVGTILSLKIYLPDSPQPIDAKGRVLWTEASSYLNAKTSKKTYYDVGLEFIEVDESNHKKLLSYIKKSSPPENTPASG